MMYGYDDGDDNEDNNDDDGYDDNRYFDDDGWRTMHYAPYTMHDVRRTMYEGCGMMDDESGMRDVD